MSTSKGERITQIAVVVIAVCAVVVSVWQGLISQRQLKLAQEHNRLTVKPYLDFIKNIDGTTQTLSVSVSNQGYGPAIVKDFAFFYRDKKFDSWNAVLDAAGENNGIRQLFNYTANSVIAPSTSRTLLILKTENSVKGIKLRIDYESIYKEETSIEFDF